MKKKITLADRFRYRFDNFMSRGTIALVVALFAATLFMVLTAAMILLLVGLRYGGNNAGTSFIDNIWQVTLHTIDTGALGSDATWSFRLVGFLVTIGGIFITSALIGVLATGLEQRFSELRRGRSRVLESGHTIIIGWSPQVFTIIDELAMANRNLSKKKQNASNGEDQRRSACVAILADRDKLEMEEEIKTKSPHTLLTKVVCRSGNPLDRDDLEIVNPEEARAIIILSPGGEYPDLPVAKSLLALTQDRANRAHAYHIVAAVQRLANMQTFRVIGGDEASIFMVDRLVAYIIAHTCRQSGLSTVFSELLSFEGAAIYFTPIPDLTSRTFGEALYRFESSTIIGLWRADQNLQLNPPADTILLPGDQVVAIAGDDDQIRLSGITDFKIDRARFSGRTSETAALGNLLILGWNHRAPMILEQLSHYATAQSHIKVFSPLPIEQIKTESSNVDYGPMQLTIEQGNPLDRLSIEKLVGEGYSLMIILSPNDASDIQIADASTMITLIHLRDIIRLTSKRIPIVSEIMDVRNRELVQVSTAEDVIISDQLIALALAQIAENKNIQSVFIELLSADRVEIYIKPIGDYVSLDTPVDFYTLSAAAQHKDEIAIGYRLLSESDQADQKFGVHINPTKSTLITFSEHDQLVVLARTKRSKVS